MNDANKTKSLKWVIGIALAGCISFYVLPILASMALNAVTIALCGIFFMALWFFLPAMSELFAQLSYRAWEMAIRGDPIARLKRELLAHAAGIADMEKRIMESDAQVIQLKNLLKEQLPMLTAEEIAEWDTQIAILVKAGKDLIELRNQSLRDHEEFRRSVDKAEAQYKLGKAFTSALGAFTFDKKTGKDADGARVAINEVQKQLAESQSRLNIVLSRKSTLTLPSASGSHVPVTIEAVQPVTARS